MELAVSCRNSLRVNRFLFFFVVTSIKNICLHRVDKLNTKLNNFLELVTGNRE